MAFSKLNEILAYVHSDNSNEWVVQRYIENPFLINKRKVDIRIWVVLTSVYPLVYWIYDNHYMRLASSEFDITKEFNK